MTHPDVVAPHPGFRGALPMIEDVSSEARGHPRHDGHERVLRVRDPVVGLDGFIAIHDTTLGPALGGCRMARYGSDREALGDALRLSVAMTYKAAAMAGLDLGGGKAVLHTVEPSPALFRSFGRAVESLGGRYITGEDVGTSVREMDWIAQQTPHVIGTSALGDPSPMTAKGVACGIRAAVRHRLGAGSLDGVTVVVQGLGHVGSALVELLAAEGARLVVADVDPARCTAVRERHAAVVVDPLEIHAVRADVFAPCALGGALDARTVPELCCAVVAGAANNQLDRKETAELLRERNILYAPDYVINAGGLIAAALSRAGHRMGSPEVDARIAGITTTLTHVFKRADAEGRPPLLIADRMADERIGRARRRSLA
jgi:leucine dehydrogenase